MNRRKFIQGVSLLSTALFVSLEAYPFSILTADVKIKGRVLSKGKGIANVVVSDGYEVVKTDAKGKFEIATNPLAKFVWVSTPAGYAFKTQNNLAHYYEDVSRSATLDFELSPLAVDDSRHNFIIWADPQVKNSSDVEKMMSTSVPDTIQTIRQMDPKIPVHGITVGDIVWDNHDLFSEYNKAVEKMGIPFFQCLGNHDMDYKMGGDETSDKTFMAHYGPTYYSFNRGKAHYIVLDDVRYLGKEREYDGFLVQHQLDWMEKDLALVPKDALIIVNLHIPVEEGVKNRDAIYKILADFKNVHIMSGHTHYNRNTITGNVFEHNHGAVCGAWWTGAICDDGTPNGYGVYEVDGTQLKWYYKSTGLDKNEQIRLYLIEDNGQKKLVANVWNWDPAWKISYELDGKAMGELKQAEGYDPDAVTTMKGPTLPKGRSFPEPHITQHLFAANLDGTTQKIKVTATDRFGNVYTAEK